MPRVVHLALAKSPYDRARLDVVAGSAIADRPILLLGDHAECAAYLEAQGKSVASAPAGPGALAFKGGELGGAVAMYSLAELSADALSSALVELARVLAPGAPLLFTAYRDDGDASAGVVAFDRRDLTALIESTGAYDRVRVESRRPYPGEAPAGLHRIFATARTATNAREPGKMGG